MYHMCRTNVQNKAKPKPVLCMRSESSMFAYIIEWLAIETLFKCDNLAKICHFICAECERRVSHQNQLKMWLSLVFRFAFGVQFNVENYFKVNVKVDEKFSYLKVDVIYLLFILWLITWTTRELNAFDVKRNNKAILRLIQYASKNQFVIIF